MSNSVWGLPSDSHAASGEATAENNLSSSISEEKNPLASGFNVGTLSPYVDDNHQRDSSIPFFPSSFNNETENISLFSNGESSVFSNEDGISTASGNENLEATVAGNRSDKTPMCLVAELARYNSIPHQYKLINEEGPAHKKVFTVSLIVGEGERKEEYTAQGASIKKAQQAAAQKALDETNLPKRPQRFAHKRRPTATTYGYCSAENAAFTPTVMLNALAFRLGVKPQFSFLTSPYPMFPGMPQVPPRFPVNLAGRAFRAGFPRLPPIPPYNLMRFPPPLPFIRFPPVPSHYVSLKIGDYEFVGQGPNRQLAKHDASLKAVRALESLLQRREQAKLSMNVDQEKEEGQNQENVEEAACSRAEVQNEDQELSQAIDSELSSANKSAINLVYEFTLKRHLDVNFEITSESGPAHMRHFVVRCLVTGVSLPPVSTEGEGASKKQAKHDAAEKMLMKLKEDNSILPQPTQPRSKLGAQPVKEKKRKPTIIKDMKSDPSYGQEVNPVSRLIQVQQAKGEPEPIFEFIREEGHARCKEFIVKVTIGETSCEGRGPNKKLAKRAAAEAMLDTMGYAKPLPKPGKPLLKHRPSSPPADENASAGVDEQINTDNSNRATDQSDENTNGALAEKHRKVKFQLGDDEAKIGRDDREEDRNSNYHFGRQRNRYGRRLAPGLFFLPFAFADSESGEQDASTINQQQEAANPSTADGSSFGTWSDMQASVLASAPTCSEGAKDQLAYLSNLLSFQVQFTDFPKTLRNGENGDFLSLVSLTTNPPLVCHGSGPSVQQAQNEAAVAVLRCLAGRGLNTDKALASAVDSPSLPIPQSSPASDGDSGANA